MKFLSLNEGREALRFCNSENRLPDLIDIAWCMGSQDWLRLLGEEWSSCDNIGAFLDDLLDDTPFNDLLADPSEGRAAHG